MDDLLQRLSRSNEVWYFSNRFEQINVAVESGISKISEWDLLTDMDKWYLMARHRALQKMRMYETYLQNKKLQQLQSSTQR